MHYRLGAAKPLRKTVPVIATGEIDAAIACLKSGGHDPKAIHSARKHFKKVRALLALVQTSARGHRAKTTQKLIASAARKLASSRDAHVAVGAAEDLAKDCETAANARAFSDLISFLKARRDRIEESFDRSGFKAVFGELGKARASAAKLDLSGTRMDDLSGPALSIYRQGRQAMKDALKSGDNEALHNWRKLTQRHWRHMLLLRETWPGAKRRIALAERLSSVLGRHNDLAVLHRTILDNRIVFGSRSDVNMLCRCIERMQAELSSKAGILGGQLYAEKAKPFARRLAVRARSL